eukprot:757770-Amphidinium_carterae.1
MPDVNRLGCWQRQTAFSNTPEVVEGAAYGLSEEQITRLRHPWQCSTQPAFGLIQRNMDGVNAHQRPIECPHMQRCSGRHIPVVSLDMVRQLL